MKRHILALILLLNLGCLKAGLPRSGRLAQATIGILKRNLNHACIPEYLPDGPIMTASRKLAPLVIKSRQLVPIISLGISDSSGTRGDDVCEKPQKPFVWALDAMGIPEHISLPWIRKMMGLKKWDQINKMVFEVPEIKNAFIDANGRMPTLDDIDYMHDEVFAPAQLAIIEDGFDIISGCAQAEEEMRAMGMILGGTTGYDEASNAEANRWLKQQGSELDFTVVPSEVCGGRPGPWMIYKNMEKAYAQTGEIYRGEETVKFDDTQDGVKEGLNAGTWSIGVAETSIEMNMTRAEKEALKEQNPEELNNRIYKSTYALHKAGAHLVIPTIKEAPKAIMLLNTFMQDPHCRPQTFKLWANDKSIKVDNILFN